MLIDSKHLRTGSAGPLGGKTPEKVLCMAFYGRAADAFALGDTATADAIPVIFEDFEAKCFCRVLAPQNSRETMPEAPAGS